MKVEDLLWLKFFFHETKAKMQRDAEQQVSIVSFLKFLFVKQSIIDNQ